MPTMQSVSSIADQIATRLRGELMAGRYEPGESLREEQVAGRFGVSRHPVRKVFQQLAQEGLLVARRNCGVTVAPAPSAHVAGLLTPLRVQIETYALRLCLPRLTDDHFAAWEGIILQLRAACDREEDGAVLDHDFAFHRAIITAAGLDDIVPVWQGVIGRMRDYHIRGNRTQPDYGIIPFIHESLLDVFRTRDAGEATRSLASHIENGEFNDEARARWASRAGRRTT